MEASQSWIVAFCRQRENALFCEVDEDFIKDSSNLTGLEKKIPHFKQALSHILKKFVPTSEDHNKDTRRETPSSQDGRITSNENRALADEATLCENFNFESECETLYGLVHARYILTAAGLRRMARRWLQGEFGRCQRVFCDLQTLMPVGLSDRLGADSVKLLCPRCVDVYHPDARKFTSQPDGAFFGTTYPHVLFLTAPLLRPPPPRKSYEPKVYGFKIVRSSNSGADTKSLNNLSKDAGASATDNPTSSASLSELLRLVDDISSTSLSSAGPESTPSSSESSDDSLSSDKYGKLSLLNESDGTIACLGPSVSEKLNTIVRDIQLCSGLSCKNVTGLHNDQFEHGYPRFPRRPLSKICTTNEIAESADDREMANDNVDILAPRKTPGTVATEKEQRTSPSRTSIPRLKGLSSSGLTSLSRSRLNGSTVSCEGASANHNASTRKGKVTSHCHTATSSFETSCTGRLNSRRHVDISKHPECGPLTVIDKNGISSTPSHTVHHLSTIAKDLRAPSTNHSFFPFPPSHAAKTASAATVTMANARTHTAPTKCPNSEDSSRGCWFRLDNKDTSSGGDGLTLSPFLHVSVPDWPNLEQQQHENSQSYSMKTARNVTRWRHTFDPSKRFQKGTSQIHQHNASTLSPILEESSQFLTSSNEASIFSENPVGSCTKREKPVFPSKSLESLNRASSNDDSDGQRRVVLDGVSRRQTRLGRTSGLSENQAGVQNENMGGRRCRNKSSRRPLIQIHCNPGSHALHSSCAEKRLLDNDGCSGDDSFCSESSENTHVFTQVMGAPSISTKSKSDFLLRCSHIPVPRGNLNSRCLKKSSVSGAPKSAPHVKKPSSQPR